MSSRQVSLKRGRVRVLPLAIRHWRTDHLGWSQEILAARASQTAAAFEHDIRVSPSMIAMMELGKRQPTEPVAACLAEALGVPVGAFAFVAGTADDLDIRTA